MDWINLKDDQPSDGTLVLVCGMKLDKEHIASCNQMIATRNITDQDTIDDLYDPVLQALYRKQTNSFITPDPQHGMIELKEVTHWQKNPKAYSDG